VRCTKRLGTGIFDRSGSWSFNRITTADRNQSANEGGGKYRAPIDCRMREKKASFRTERIGVRCD
jgi:hypothetical protein